TCLTASYRNPEKSIHYPCDGVHPKSFSGLVVLQGPWEMRRRVRAPSDLQEEECVMTVRRRAKSAEEAPSQPGDDERRLDPELTHHGRSRPRSHSISSTSVGAYPEQDVDARVAMASSERGNQGQAASKR